MFTYIKLKNFLSFQEITFDLKKSQNHIKRFVAIYGENGSGKSNLIRSLRFLRQSLVSMKLKFESDQLRDQVDAMENEESAAHLFQQYLRIRNFSQTFGDYRMVDCDEPTEVEYGFSHKGHEGYYKIAFTDRIREETLYWLREKQRGILFHLADGDKDHITTEIHSSVTLTEDAEKALIKEIDKYWGKHSFLSIISNYMSGKNPKYIRDNLSNSLAEVLSCFDHMTVITKDPYNHGGFISTKPKGILKRLDYGTISDSEDDRTALKKTERIVRDFFSQTYADIKDVYYKTETVSGGKLSYELFVVKMIGGKAREISFAKESAGTQQVLEIIRALIGVFFGVVVVYDEIDNGIHDLLLQQIINSLEGEITGQLIITTHNTQLMQSMSPHSAYIIQVDHMGNKELQCIAQYALQKNHNMQSVYLKGLVGGTPYLDFIDYDFLRETLDEEGSSSS